MSATSVQRNVSINSPVMSTGSEDATDAVYNANLVTEATSSIKNWRPKSSISQPEVLQEDDLDQDLDGDDLDIRDETCYSPRDKQIFVRRNEDSNQYAQSLYSGRCRSNLDNYVLQRRSLRQPCKYKPSGGPSKGQHKSFITMTQRTRTTFDGIQGVQRVVSNSYGDRIIRPYSTYSVSKSCERLAISPYGGPLLPSAVGRYREQYHSRNPPKISKATQNALNAKFQKFYINQDLIAITQNKLPAGVLKKPPSPKVSKPQREQSSLHRGATERMNAVQTTLGWKQPEIAADGKRFGVAYQVAMELTHNLEKHRKARSATVVPEVPPSFQAPISDTARLNNQALDYLTHGEFAIRQSIKANQFDSNKPKKEPTKFIKKRPPSPPLSKLSRDKFLPEALRRRAEMEKTRTYSGHSGLRLGKTTGISFAEDDAIASRGMDRNFHVDEGTGSDLSSSHHSGDFDDKDLMIRGQSAKHSPRSDFDDKDLMIRGQSAKHSPRSDFNLDKDYHITTTPRCSPEPQSRATTAKSKQPVSHYTSDSEEDEVASVTENDTIENSRETERKDFSNEKTSCEQEKQHTKQIGSEDKSTNDTPKSTSTEENINLPHEEVPEGKLNAIDNAHTASATDITPETNANKDQDLDTTQTPENGSKDPIIEHGGQSNNVGVVEKDAEPSDQTENGSNKSSK